MTAQPANSPRATVTPSAVAKPEMMIKWHGEEALPIARDAAARAIRKNRRQPAGLQVRVLRKFGETFIASKPLGIGCVIFKA